MNTAVAGASGTMKQTPERRKRTLPRAAARPTTLMPQTEDQIFYQLYFQPPGVAEADLQSDVRSFIRGLLFGNSGDGPLKGFGLPPDGVGMVPRAGGPVDSRGLDIFVLTDDGRIRALYQFAEPL